MDEKQLARINAIVGELYDDVTSLSEELVDGNFKEADAVIDRLVLKLKSIKADIKDDEI